jgi:hypothetical protein
MAKLPQTSPEELEALWRVGKALKLAPGTYVAKTGAYIVVNGFFGSMRAQYTDPIKAPRGLQWFALAWAEADLPWATFRADVVGATDPATAHAGSLRRRILASWQELGLGAAPFGAENGVHASASALEAAAERHIWLGRPLDGTDPFGAAWAQAGLPPAELGRWCGNPREALTVPLEQGGSGAAAEQDVFDAVEGKGTSDLLKIASASLCGGAVVAPQLL